MPLNINDDIDFAEREVEREMPDYLQAVDAARALKVKPQTLYTYVSRGLIRAVHQADRKEKLYFREDIEKLRSRSVVRVSHGPIGEHGRPFAPAADVTRWGQPALSTAITEITADGPMYRGRSAIELARDGASFEAVADFLWTGVDQGTAPPWEIETIPHGFGQQLDVVVLPSFRAPVARPPVLRQAVVRSTVIRAGATRPSILRVFASATSLLGAGDSEQTDIQRGTTIPSARQLIGTLAGCLGYLAPTPAFRAPAVGHSIAANVARTLTPNVSKDAIAAIDAVFVLAADHELSPSTFAARVAASTGADLRACVLAAIATHSGPSLGGTFDRIEDLLRNEPSIERFNESGVGRASGFSVVAYPNGDPRARYLLDLARGLAAGIGPAERILQFISDVEQRLKLRPTIETALVALTSALSLPQRSAGALWALGRSAGWIAHIMEQRLAGVVMRPRARFAGAA